MSIKLAKIWECDSCGHQEIRQSYGLPKHGWIFSNGKHKCDKCSTPQEIKAFDKQNAKASLKYVIAEN